MRAPGESNADAYVAVAVALLVGTLLSLTARAQSLAFGRVRVVDTLVPAQVSDFLRPVDITGEVKHPGTYPVVDAPTLAQLLEMAGGVTGNAGSTAILVHFSENAPVTPLSRATLVRLTRPGSALPRNVTLTRIAVADSGALNKQLRLDAQDILFVPGKNES
jgi:protein involved in polysaccharide export with SLBB domain